ncbi:MAG: N-acetylglucosamine-6-phosphate deacetylase [Erysipelotrichaceae bacterium]|jgi:N-acetylglucosamine-6-phosphate deacetylase|nr:N-acetylglucosamine-6-phosphate deacetylase [Bacillota bacterium]HCY07099.1 N-acetylglucosamine-6-phosphate deacetylase [Erysipelotrichaceae bacterium]
MIIQSKKVWLAGQFHPAQLEVEGNKIVAVLNYGTKEADKDYGDKRIVPGFIDVHCHGAYGFDTNDAHPEGLRKWLKNVTSEGVTGLLPTTITQSKEVLTNAIKNVVNVYNEGYEGAEILGIHFEGPYLDMKYKGAQPEQHILKPDVEQFKEYQEAAEGLIKIVTLATEHDENFELTKYLASTNVVASIGHSSATIEEALMAIANGAQSMTHVYNGMTPFNHRENGLVGAALRFKDVYGEIICDLNHSTPNAVNIFYKSKNDEKAVMISDGLMAKGFKVGDKFMFGGNEIEIYPDGSAHLTSSKSLAGSTMKMNEGLRNVVEIAEVPFAKALNSCTINPATLIGVNDRKGRLYEGYDADIVVLDDDYSVIQTYCNGVAQL